MKADDVLSKMVHCRNRDKILFFTESGQVYSVHAYHISESSRASAGSKIASIVGIPKDDEINAIVCIPHDSVDPDLMLVQVTRDGMIKKTPLAEYQNINKSGKIAIKLNPGDILKGVKVAEKDSVVVIASDFGRCIMFKLDDLRAIGRGSRGVRALNMNKNNKVVTMDVVKAEYLATEQDNIASDDDEAYSVTSEDDTLVPCILSVSKKAKIKRTPLKLFRTQARNGVGVVLSKFDKGDSLAGFQIVGTGDLQQEVLIASKQGIVNRLSVAKIPIYKGRTAKGVMGLKLKSEDQVKTIAVVALNPEDDLDGNKSA
eukprot:CAMPEP_0197861190 /NCGR_PEP_ID=MMETSP1438-20131217/37080_1 /TAXON_ID=1461541 /ORGANISM="Pterosperma sp., Strain CCMP1384" /LENGTH=314 /DNA_ID=CAMNT_0043478285 /DNA_START=73 /DNA_END=1017 /DNA_ORIENTATION=-